MGDMRIAPGKVVNGRIELDAELPEGTRVTVYRVVTDPERIEILAFWHESRGSGPSL